MFSAGVAIVGHLAAISFALALAACGGFNTGPLSDPSSEATLAARTCIGDNGRGVVRIAGGAFKMGQADVYAEEGPVRTVTVSPFWIDRTEVTNAQFARFVAATGYVTVAEQPVDPSAFAVRVEQIPPDMLKPGSAVFTQPDHPSNRYTDWWAYVPGANWKKPYGPTGPDQGANEPVVHLAYADMEAYAKWRGGRIPTEAEWEFAAKAGRPDYTAQPDEANSWQGVFPVVNEKADGFEGIAPVGCFAANPLGLYDMIGNVWEMTSDFYAPGHDPRAPARDPKGPSENDAYDPANPGMPSRVIKGGSYLCAPNYCRRYRPAARTGRDSGLGASNVGFRTAYDREPVQNGN
jgi:sulfatase modifying factor 1